MPLFVTARNRRRSSMYAAAARGALRPVIPGVFTSDLETPLEDLVRAHLLAAVAAVYPGAVIADRSARSGGRPESDGSLFIVHETKRATTLPGGVVVRSRTGAGPLEGDMPFGEGLWLASEPRSLLENAVLTRGRGARVARTLSRVELEEWLESLLVQRGAEGLNQLRDRARELAPQLGLGEQFTLIDGLIGSALGTRRARAHSQRLRSRQHGEAYDPDRLQLFERLRDELASRSPLVRPVLGDPERYALLPFFEAYFSNSIEGTRFTVDEAAAIALQGQIPPARPADAHDVLGTYRIVSDRQEMARTARGVGEYLELLRRRHAVVLEGRPDTRPGQFKSEPNEAGGLLFVDPTLVNGTLARGFELVQTLTSAFARAVFQMFVVSEVHPFADGNGRIARIMMNSELVAAGEQRIIIPSVYRHNYLMGLRGMSTNGNAAAMIATLDFAQRYTAAIDYRDLETARAVLQATNAFREADEEAAGLTRLELP